jgi:hypothetical protein
MGYWAVFSGDKVVANIYAKNRRVAEREFKASKRDGILPVDSKLSRIRMPFALEANEVGTVKLSVRL